MRFLSGVSQCLETTTKEMKFDLFSTCFLNDSETPYTGEKADLRTSLHVLKNIAPAVPQVFHAGGKHSVNKPWCLVFSGLFLTDFAGVTLGTEGSSSPSLLAGF